MPTYPFTIDGIAFYATEAPNWQPYGGIDAFSILGRPLPFGQGTFTVTLQAVPYSPGSLTGTGDPLESSGAFQELVGLALNAKNTTGGRSTFHTFDPTTNTYVTIKGIIDLAALLSKFTPGVSNRAVEITVMSAFIDDDTWAEYTGGDPYPVASAPYIPGDPLPPGDPAKTYGWNLGGWNAGYYGRGEGV